MRNFNTGRHRGVPALRLVALATLVAAVVAALDVLPARRRVGVVVNIPNRGDGSVILGLRAERANGGLGGHPGDRHPGGPAAGHDVGHAGGRERSWLGSTR